MPKIDEGSQSQPVVRLSFGVLTDGTGIRVEITFADPDDAIVAFQTIQSWGLSMQQSGRMRHWEQSSNQISVICDVNASFRSNLVLVGRGLYTQVGQKLQAAQYTVIFDSN